MAVTGLTPSETDLTQEGLPIPDADDLVPAAPQPARRVKGRSPLAGLLNNRKAAVGASILLLFVVAGIFAPWIAQYAPDDFVARPNQAPSREHWFGTDGYGQDVFARTVWGARNSLSTGLIVGIAVTVIGTIVGMTAGYFRGRVDDVLSVVMNVMLIVPTIPLMIVLAAFLKPGFWTIVAVLTGTGWAWGARVLRSQTLALREKDFVSSAQVAGERAPRIIFREILPNMLSIMMAGMFGAVIFAIGAQAALEFLGLGNPSTISWGTNLYWAQNNGGLITGSWWTFVPSGSCIALVAFSFALLNFAIDELTNPRLRSQRETQAVMRKSKRNLGSSRATPVLRSETGAS
jgi:peptide/nickel transport system permease protein